MKVCKVCSILLIVLIITATACTAVFKETVSDEVKKINLENTPYINAKIDIPEGFEKGAPVTANTLQDVYKGSANINLSRLYMGDDRNLEEYIRDSKERLEDDIYSFMDFAFVSDEGLVLKGDNRKAIAFEALQNKVINKFWMVYVQKDEYVFQITCSSAKEEFNSLEEMFNKVIDSFEITK